MPEARPDIPRPLEREVLLEAGHRCAIPTCRTVPVEIAHIIPWSKVQEHAFDNLIALCPTCHRRYDRGDIDRQSMLQYKVNLSVLSSRYGDLERRILEILARGGPGESAIALADNMRLLFVYLLGDGLIAEVSMTESMKTMLGEGTKLYGLTPKGRQFATRWLSAQEL
jgi:hypothetical protein